MFLQPHGVISLRSVMKFGNANHTLRQEGKREVQDMSKNGQNKEGSYFKTVLNEFTPQSSDLFHELP